MRARPGRGMLLGALSLLGAGLLAIASVMQVRESASRSAPKPEQAWRSADRSDAFLVNRLRRLSPADTTATQRVLARLQSCAFLDTTSIQLHMTRRLNSGHEFDAEITVTHRAAEAGEDVELTVMRTGRDPVRLRAQLRSGEITGFEQAVTPASTWQPWTTEPGLPFAIGDLDLSECVALCRAFALGALEPLGYLCGMGAEPQLVLAANLGRAEPADDSKAAAARRETVGIGALAYVDSATSRLRRVCVLDAKGYVVRIYEDLVWDTSRSRPRLSELHVASMPSSSQTVLRRVDVAPTDE